MELGMEKVNIQRVSNGQPEGVLDSVAVEAPLEIQLKRAGKKPKALSVTMRTPGDDEELAMGFLYTEGILTTYDDVKAVSYEGDNIIKIHVTDNFVLPDTSFERNFYTTSSCGVCGKASIDAIHTRSHFQIERTHPVREEVLFGLKDKLIGVQSLFSATGGIHAVGLFNLDGELLQIREDVGRHNAMDKLVGYAFKKGLLPLNKHLVLLSGRASFELIQKATMAGIPNVVSVGAPSSLAIDLAVANNQRLYGFLKSDSFNIYC
jgi:FdhD protein